MSESEKADYSDGLPRHIDVELFIVHPKMTPEEITDALKLEAHIAHCVGDQSKARNGKLLKGKNRDTRWRHSIRYELRDQWFADKITILVDRLAARKAFFHRLRATGGTAEIIVQFLGDGYLGDSVPLETLSKMTELQLEFGIECFTVPQS